jgi:hypothetical protein
VLSFILIKMTFKVIKVTRNYPALSELAKIPSFMMDRDGFVKPAAKEKSSRKRKYTTKGAQDRSAPAGIKRRKRLQKLQSRARVTGGQSNGRGVCESWNSRVDILLLTFC